MIVCGEKLWRVLFDYGVRGRLLQSVKALYEGGRAMESEGLGVRSHSGLGCIRVHVRQGCTLSPLLYYFIDNVVKEARRECIREVTLSTVR